MKIAHVLKTLTGGWLAALCFACSPQMPDAYTESQDAPDIYPDYTDVTVPPNIAPLRFIVDEKADAYAARIKYPGGEWTTDEREVTPLRLAVARHAGFGQRWRARRGSLCGTRRTMDSPPAI